MAMMRKEGPGDYQIGIWSVRREGRKWRAVATGPGTLGDGSPQIFATLGAAYLDLTGEPLRESRNVHTRGAASATGKTGEPGENN